MTLLNKCRYKNSINNMLFCSIAWLIFTFYVADVLAKMNFQSKEVYYALHAFTSAVILCVIFHCRGKLN